MTDQITKRWQDWVNLVLGAWLVLSPWLLGFMPEGWSEGSPMFWNALIVGVAVIVFALVAVNMPQRWEEGINMILGIWLIISPWVLGYNTMTNVSAAMIITGVVITACALWAMLDRGGSKWLHDKFSH